MPTFFNRKPEGWGVTSPAPKLSNAKAAAAARELAVSNPNRARIEAKIAQFKNK